MTIKKNGNFEYRYIIDYMQDWGELYFSEPKLMKTFCSFSKSFKNRNNIDVIPDKCRYLYISDWGGEVKSEQMGVLTHILPVVLAGGYAIVRATQR